VSDPACDLRSRSQGRPAGSLTPHLSVSSISPSAVVVVPEYRCTIDRRVHRSIQRCVMLILIVSSGRALMPKRVPLPPRGFDDLSVDEKIDYVQSLWDRIAASPEAIPAPERHLEILDQRLKDLEANPGAGDSWDIVQERLRKTLDNKP
jgi:putative addiction module component (TIGR02574 family)